MELIKLGEIAEISSGNSAPQEDNVFSESGYPFIRAGSLESIIGNDDLSVLEHLTPETAKKYRMKLFPKNTVLFAKSGMSAKLGRIYLLKEPAYIVSHLATIIPSYQVSPSYLMRWFQYRPPSYLIPNESYPSIRLSEIANIKIPLPPIAVQRKIASILDKADEIRKKRQEAIKLTEELGRSLFLDMFGDPVTNPKGWEIRKLEDVLSIVSGQVDPKSKPYIDMPHVGGENMESNTNKLIKIKTPRELGLKSGKYLFKADDVLYSKIRPYLNQVVIPYFEGVCSADIYPLRVNKNKIDQNFLAYLLRSKFFLDYAEKHSTRTNIPKINRPTLLSFEFPCPSLDKQKTFSNQCQKILKLQNNHTQYMTESENLFNSLLQRAFKGEL